VTFRGSGHNFNKEFRAPWLIQRCKIAAPYRIGQKVSAWLRLDYMGSAEFEFGAIPATLREFAARLKTGLAVTEIRVGRATFWVLSLPGQADGYRAWLQKYEGKDCPRLKEFVEFPALVAGEPPHDWERNRSDLWIDLDNCAAISTDPVAIGDFSYAVKASVKFMDENHPSPNKGGAK
jgi:hypothetical protein